MTKNNRTTRGFTLLEILIAVLIVGIIATAALPMLGSYTEKAREAREEANMVVKAQAEERYGTDHKAGLGLVYDPDTNSLLEYGIVSARGPSAQLLLPTDANGNVQGDPVTASPGPYSYGPYLAQLPPEPASVLLGAGVKGIKEVPPYLEDGFGAWIAVLSIPDGVQVGVHAAAFKSGVFTKDFGSTVAAATPVYSRTVTLALAGIDPDEPWIQMAPVLEAMDAVIRQVGSLETVTRRWDAKPSGWSVFYPEAKEYGKKSEAAKIVLELAEEWRGHTAQYTMYNDIDAPGSFPNVFAAMAQHGAVIDAAVAAARTKAPAQKDHAAILKVRQEFMSVFGALERVKAIQPSDPVVEAAQKKLSGELTIRANAYWEAIQSTNFRPPLAPSNLHQYLAIDFEGGVMATADALYLNPDQGRKLSAGKEAMISSTVDLGEPVLGTDTLTSRAYGERTQLISAAEVGSLTRGLLANGGMTDIIWASQKAAGTISVDRPLVLASISGKLKAKGYTFDVTMDPKAQLIDFALSAQRNVQWGGEDRLFTMRYIPSRISTAIGRHTLGAGQRGTPYGVWTHRPEKAYERLLNLVLIEAGVQAYQALSGNESNP